MIVETPNNTKRVIVVLGMHRSGTSAIARGLKVLGVELGDNLLPAQPDNVRGFWEDKKVVQINTALLNSCGQDWHTFGALDVSQQYELMQQARDYIKGVLKDVAVWGYKDPRTARLLPFWNSVFNSLAINSSYCVVIRHPLSVAKSLKERNRFELLRSSLLWYQYSMDMLDGIGDGVFTVVDYDEFLENPRSELERIAKGLKLEEAFNEQRVREYCDNYLSPTFRHSRYDQNNLDGNDGIPSEVADAYRYFLELRTQERSCISADLRIHLAQWRTCQKYYRSLFFLINELGESVDQTLKERGSMIAEAKIIKQRHQMAVTSLEQTLKERDLVLAEAEIYRQRHQMAVASLEQTQDEVEDIRRLVNELLNSASWKITTPLRAVVSLMKAAAGIIIKRK